MVVSDVNVWLTALNSVIRLIPQTGVHIVLRVVLYAPGVQRVQPPLYFHCPGDDDACNGRAGRGGLGCYSLFHLASAVSILVVFLCTESKAGLNAEPIPTLPYVISLHVVNFMSYIQRHFVPRDLPGCIWLGKLFRSGTSMKMCPPFKYAAPRCSLLYYTQIPGIKSMKLASP